MVAVLEELVEELNSLLTTKSSQIKPGVGDVFVIDSEFKVIHVVL